MNFDIRMHFTRHQFVFSQIITSITSFLMNVIALHVFQDKTLRIWILFYSLYIASLGLQRSVFLDLLLLERFSKNTGVLLNAAKRLRFLTIGISLFYILISQFSSLGFYLLSTVFVLLSLEQDRRRYMWRKFNVSAVMKADSRWLIALIFIGLANLNYDLPISINFALLTLVPFLGFLPDNKIVADGNMPELSMHLLKQNILVLMCSAICTYIIISSLTTDDLRMWRYLLISFSPLATLSSLSWIVIAQKNDSQRLFSRSLALFSLLVSLFVGLFAFLTIHSIFRLDVAPIYFALGITPFTLSIATLYLAKSIRDMNLGKEMFVISILSVVFQISFFTFVANNMSTLFVFIGMAINVLIVTFLSYLAILIRSKGDKSV